ncbi:MAG: hypothetical protein Q7U96_02960 [Chloroflexota bacterium]|nr:hypothetical protein [Chloroflexota bacterium]
MNILCVKCKGRKLCGRAICPITAKSEALFKVKELTEKDFFGSSPAPFVGHYGYPYVNVGILSPPIITEDAWEYDAPRHWAVSNYEIPQIVDYRSALINSRFKAQIKEKSSRFLELSQEIGMASKPVDVEINLKKKPFVRMDFSPEVAPMGPRGELKSAKATENPKIHAKVDKVVSDTDLKATDAILYLYKNEFDENFLSRMLSIGTLGLKKNRKLVPTRWSITACDDILGKNFINKIKDYQAANYQIYFGGYLGNYFLIMLFPEVWSYELFETYAPKASWNTSQEVQFTTDYEPYGGRKTYAENCIGGYYSNRVVITEKLANLKRQASVLSLRFITGEYSVPLGVWVVREATRKALSSKPIEFSSKELMLSYAKNLVKEKFNINTDQILKHSILLKSIKQQSKLTQFF